MSSTELTEQDELKSANESAEASFQRFRSTLVDSECNIQRATTGMLEQLKADIENVADLPDALAAVGETLLNPYYSEAILKTRVARMNLDHLSSLVTRIMVS